MSAWPVKNWQDVFARVRGALRRRGQTEHEAEDLVHEAWLRLVRYENEQQPVEQPEAFLMRTALNLSIDAHRMHVGRGEHVLLEDVVLLDTAPSIEAAVLARERMARFAQGVARLSERTRDVFVANRIDGLSYAEVATRYGISIATLHQHLTKATLRLTEWMEGW
jgi:RNA polymerase sigma-70 factor (ECF subfamily)